MNYSSNEITFEEKYACVLKLIDESVANKDSHSIDLLTRFFAWKLGDKDIPCMSEFSRLVQGYLAVAILNPDELVKLGDYLKEKVSNEKGE